MDGERFDDLSRKLVSRRSRREVFGLLGATVAGLLTGRSTAAAPKNENPGGGKPVQDKPSKCYGEGSHCTNGKQCCSGVCTNRQCAPEVVLVCEPDSTRTCYTGPDGTVGVGICQAGTQTCLPDGSGYGLCEGEVLPTTEACNGVDDNCNGVPDDGAVCPPTTECRSGSCCVTSGNPNLRGSGFPCCNDPSSLNINCP